MATETRQLPPLAMRATFQPETVDVEARTVDVIWTTGARVLRGFWDRYWEELSLDPKHVRMERLNNGAPFLDGHQGYSAARDVMGVVVSARLEKGRGVATVRFTPAGVDPEADRLFEKIRVGVVQNVSVGYRVHKLEKIEDGEDKIPIMRATLWEPYEISAVPMGADDGAGVRAAGGETNPCEVITRGLEPQKDKAMSDEMNTTPDPVQAERARAADIHKLCARAQFPELAGELISSGMTLDQARARVLDAIATRSESYGGPPPGPSGAVERFRVGDTLDSMDKRISAMSEALAHRAGNRGQLSDRARQHAQLGIADMARIILEGRGESVRFMNRPQIVRMALERRGGVYHTTDNFPGLLKEAGNRVLLDGYTSYTGGIRQISRRTTAPDFRSKYALRLGEFPELKEVKEHGEVTYGSMTEGKESYSLKTFARIFSLSRQAMINDDLGAFDIVRRYGRAAAEMESNELIKLITANAGLGVFMADGKPVFHLDHGNVPAAGAAITIDSLGEALKSMRLQKMLGSSTPLNVQPRFLLVPAALEVLAMQYVAQITATTADDVNPFASKLEVVIEPRLDAIDDEAWIVAADQEVTPGLEHALLEGAEGPELVEEVGFEIEGVKWKVREDFGCGVVGYEGLYRCPKP